MNPAVKIILLLLALPFLIVFFMIVMVPLALILLFFLLFMPSIRLFHFRRFSGTEQTASEHRRGDSPDDGNVLDVECTVVDSADNQDKNSSGQPPELNP